MISGANDVELTVANDRADLLLEIQDLKEKLALVNEMNVANYNKYCDLLKTVNRANNYLTILIQTILEQPSENPVDDLWLLEKLESISKMLGGKE